MGTVEERVLIVRQDLYDRFQTILTETQMDTNELIEHLFDLYNSNVEKVWSESEESKKIKKVGLQKETEYWMKKILTKSEQAKIFGKNSDLQDKDEDNGNVDDNDIGEEQSSTLCIDVKNRSLPITPPVKEPEINLLQIPAKLPEKQAQSNRIILTLPSNLLSRDISINIGNKMTKIKPKLPNRDIVETVTKESPAKEQGIVIMEDRPQESEVMEVEVVKGSNSENTNTEQSATSNAPSTSDSINTDDNSSNSTALSQSEEVVNSSEDKSIPCIVDVSSIKQEVHEIFFGEEQQEVQGKGEPKRGNDNSEFEVESVKGSSQIEETKGSEQGGKGNSLPQESIENDQSEAIMFVDPQGTTTTVTDSELGIVDEPTSSGQYEYESFSIGNDEDDTELGENLEMTVDEVDDSYQEDSKFVRDLALNIAKNMAVTENGETVFNCNFCNYKTSVIGRLRRHITVHTGKEFKCPYCDKDYTEKCKLKEHIKVKHEKSVSYPCSKCPKKFTSKRGRDYHNITYHEERGTVLKCSFCPKEFSSRFGFTYHTKTAHGENKVEENFESTKDTLIPMTKWEKSTLKKGDKEFPKDKDGNYSCKLCDYKTPRMFHIKRHLSVHYGNTNKCTECDKTFSDPYKLRIHIQVKHGTLRFDCPQCRKSFGTKEGLKYHRITTHEGNWKYLCTECGKCFYQKHHFEGHMNKHKGIKAFECKDCGQKFTYRSDVSIHKKHCGQERRPLEKPEFFVCHVCGDQFKKKSVLTEHVMGKHGQEGTYICACGVSFKWRNSLRQHKQRCPVASTASDLDAATNFVEMRLKQELEDNSEYILDQSSTSMDEGREEMLYDITEEELEQNQAILGMEGRTPAADDGVMEGVSPSRTNEPPYQVSDSESDDLETINNRVKGHLSDVSEFKEQGLCEWNAVRFRDDSSDSDEDLNIARYTHNSWRPRHKPFTSIRNHLARKWKCSSCGKSFSVLSRFHRHKQICHPRGSEKRRVLEMFVCGFCDGRFSNRSHLREHIIGKHGIGANQRLERRYKSAAKEDEKSGVSDLVKGNCEILKSVVSNISNNQHVELEKLNLNSNELKDVPCTEQEADSLKQDGCEQNMEQNSDVEFCREETPKDSSTENEIIANKETKSQEHLEDLHSKVLSAPIDLDSISSDSLVVHSLELSGSQSRDVESGSQIQNHVPSTDDHNIKLSSQFQHAGSDFQVHDSRSDSQFQNFRSILHRQESRPCSQTQSSESFSQDPGLESCSEVHDLLSSSHVEDLCLNTSDKDFQGASSPTSSFTSKSCIQDLVSSKILVKETTKVQTEDLNHHVQELLMNTELKNCGSKFSSQDLCTSTFENTARTDDSDCNRVLDGNSASMFQNYSPDKSDNLHTTKMMCSSNSGDCEMIMSNPNVSVIDLSHIPDVTPNNSYYHSADVTNQETGDYFTPEKNKSGLSTSFSPCDITYTEQNKSDKSKGLISNIGYENSNTNDHLFGLCHADTSKVSNSGLSQESINLSKDKATSVMPIKLFKTETKEISEAGNSFTERGITVLKCKICGDQFTRPAYLREHMLGKHSGRKRYSCACGEMFKWRSSLNLHKRKCSQSGRFVFRGINNQIAIFPSRGKTPSSHQGSRFQRGLYKKPSTSSLSTKLPKNDHEPSTSSLSIKLPKNDQVRTNFGENVHKSSVIHSQTINPTVKSDPPHKEQSLAFPNFIGSQSSYVSTISTDKAMFMLPSRSIHPSFYPKPAVEPFSPEILASSSTTTKSQTPVTFSSGNPLNIIGGNIPHFSQYATRTPCQPQQADHFTDYSYHSESSQRTSYSESGAYKVDNSNKTIVNITSVSNSAPPAHNHSSVTVAKDSTGVIDLANIKQEVIDHIEDSLQKNTPSDQSVLNSSGSVETNVNSGYKIPSIMHLFKNKNITPPLSRIDRTQHQVNDTETGLKQASKFVCHLCLHTCSTFKQYEEHMMLHNVPRSSQSMTVISHTTPAPSVSTSVLSNSRTNSTPTGDQFTCKICGDTFMMKSYLREHEQGMHGSGMRYRCVCGHAFRWRSSLGSHQKKCPKSCKYTGGAPTF